MEYDKFLNLAVKLMSNRVYVGEGSFCAYKQCVESFKMEHSDIMEQYDLTESELFVMFMMTMKNYSDVQEQFFIPSRANSFTRACALLFDSFLNKTPRSTFSTFYRSDEYQRIGNFENKLYWVCQHYLTTSTSSSIYKKRPKGIKIIITRRLIGDSKAHEVFRICNVLDEFQVNFERNTRFRIDNIDREDKVVYLTEL